ncbi:B12-binding domain-containing radical SAM protein [Candidatus Omnitrophota bacterium]
MKVALINPRAKNPKEIQQKCFAPLNLLYLASSLEASGHQLEVIDANALQLSEQQIGQKIRLFRPDLIGLSLLSEVLLPSFPLIQYVRGLYPQGQIVLGGAHANALPEQVLEEFPAADYVLVGESEQSLPQLCQVLKMRQDFSSVPGLYYRRAGRILSNQPALPVKDLDILAPPARYLVAREYKEKRYQMILVKQRPVDILLTSRGCPYRCRFCSNIAGEYRARSAENVLAELLLRRGQGIRNFDFADANFTFDRRRAMRIFALIKKEKLGISFRFKSRADSIDRELTREAKAAGAYLISLGMESGSQKMLERMGKGTKLEDNIKACQSVLQAGLKLNTGWIIGFPGETMQTIEETVKLIVKIKPTTANINLLVPYPGTAVYAEAKANQQLVGDWSVKQNSIPWVKLPWASSYAQLQGIVRQVRNKVYYRPFYLFNFAKEIIANANTHLARYAFQEACKSIGPRR